MTNRSTAAALLLLLICMTAGAEKQPGVLRAVSYSSDSLSTFSKALSVKITHHLAPSCPSMQPITACPLHLAPVCGSDGNTYPNECSLCVHRQETRMDILIAKDGDC